MSDSQHLIGLLLGTEEDWPTAFEAVVRRLGPVVDGRGTVRARFEGLTTRREVEAAVREVLGR